MNRHFILIAMGAAGMIHSGCTPPRMNQAMRDSLEAGEVAKVQYFLADQIVLRRVMKTNENDVTPGHQVKIVKGKRIEEIVFPKRSAGISVEDSGNPNKLHIGFEPGSEEHPNPYLPFSVDESGNFVFLSGQEVSYQGKAFTACVGTLSPDDVINLLTLQGIHCTNTRKAFLNVSLKREKKSTKERRVVPGRRVAD